MFSNNIKKYKNQKKYRYKGYDYSQNGFYFVTICTKNKERFFGKVDDGKVELSIIGKIANKFWLEIPKKFSNLNLDKYIIMPNHVHGIIIIENDCRNAPRRVPTVWCVPTERHVGIQPLIKNSLSSIINHYKGNVKRYCNKNNFEYFVWQSRFHDRIIRNENELNRIRKYIIDNLRKWSLDRNNALIK